MNIQHTTASSVIRQQNVFDPRIISNDERAQRLWTTESVNLANKGLADGYKLVETPYNARISGDVRLRRANLPFKYTAEEFAEKKKAMYDKIYFGNNHISLKDPIFGWQRINLRDYQRNLLKRYEDNRWNIILFPRQAGKTTTTIIEIVHFMTFNIDKDCVVIAQSQKVVDEILQKIKYAFHSLPFYIQPGFVSFTNDKIVLDNGCRLSIGVASESVVQGFSLDLLYVDEFAYIKESMVNKFWINIYPSLQSNPNSRCIITSTPNGRNLFHTIWTGAVNKTNTFVPYRIYVTDVPRKQPFEEFKKEVIKNVGLDGWLLGYECSFDVGLKSVFHTTTQLKLREWQRSGEDVLDENGKTVERIWSNDNSFLGAMHKDLSFIKQGTKISVGDEVYHLTYDFRKDKFVMTVDISEGLEQDYTTMKLYKILWSEKNKKLIYINVAVLRTNDTSVEDFARLIADLLRHINQSNIRIVVESNNYGGEFFTTIRYLRNYDVKYKHIKMESFARSFRESTKKLEYGIRLNEEVKAVGIKRFVNLVKSDTLFSSHGESIEEYLNFGRQKNGTFKANYGNDDLVMSDVDLSYWLMADDSNSNGYLKDVESFLRDINDKPDNIVMIYDSDQTTREKIYFNSNEYRVRDHEKALSLSNNSKPDIYQDSDYFDDNGSHTINPLMSSVFI